MWITKIFILNVIQNKKLLILKNLAENQLLIIFKASDITFAVSLYSWESAKRIGTAFAVLLEKVFMAIFLTINIFSFKKK